MRKMRDLVILFVHAVVIFFRLTRPGGLRSVVAESVLIKHQLQILNRNRKRASNLRPLDRIILGFCTLFVRRTRLRRSAVTLRPSTLLHFHDLLRKRKYRALFSAFGVEIDKDVARRILSVHYWPESDSGPSG
jgi:putative transposase